jgi:hypothetical protein
MPKYYIKIDDKEYILSRRSIEKAIFDIFKDYTSEPTGKTIYISETGFNTTQRWMCYSAKYYYKKFLEKGLDDNKQ